MPEAGNESGCIIEDKPRRINEDSSAITILMSIMMRRINPYMIMAGLESLARYIVIKIQAAVK
jgi:hypothetical protein